MPLLRLAPIVALLILASNLPAKDPAPKSASASDYTVAKGSLSPDGRYAIAYLKKTPEDVNKVKNYVVAVKPFRIIAEVHGDGVRADSKKWAVEVRWTADSSAVIATTKFDKWDMIVGSSYVELRDGNAARRIDLLSEINGQLVADFRKSKGAVYNEFLPIILTGSEVTFEAGGKAIRVKSEATNDPNIARNISWNAEFEGIWSVTDGKWKILKLKSTATKNS
jgi:hypothetical protein